MRIAFYSASCLIVLAAAALPSRADERLPSAEEVVAKIQQAEAKADRPIEVKGFKGQNLTLNSDGQFIPTKKKVEGNAVRDGKLGGRYLIDRVEVSPVESMDSGKFITSTIVESYDGEETRIVMQSEKRANHRGRGQAVIDADDAAGVMLRYTTLCDGSAATLGHFVGFLEVQGSKSPLLGDALAKLLESKVVLTVAHERVGDTPAIRLSDPFGSNYWFDPAKGFSLIQAITTERRAVGKLGFHKLLIEEFAQLAPDRWYPIKAHWDEPAFKPPGAPDRIAFTIESVAYVQDPNFKFYAPIPPDYIVDDRIRCTVYQSTDGNPDKAPATSPVLP